MSGGDQYQKANQELIVSPTDDLHIELTDRMAFAYGGEMEGVELQIRSHGPRVSAPSIPFSTHTYPLSLDERIRQGEQFESAKKRLEDTLESITQAPFHGEHSDDPEMCERCFFKKDQIKAAYREFYLSSDPDSWPAKLPRYRHEVEEKFNDADDFSLKGIHALFQAAHREHLKQDLCARRPTEPNRVSDFKSGISGMFKDHYSLPFILIQYSTYSPLVEAGEDTDLQAIAPFLQGVNESSTKEERARIYIDYYCSPSLQDSPERKAVKAKYQRMFEQLVPHDQVLAAWRKEAEEVQASKIDSLQREISELQMGLNAHLKNKARKEERMIVDREPTPYMMQCSLDGCANEINIAVEEVIECAICEWLNSRGGGRRRYIYCSAEHADLDFDEHDKRKHKCCMGDRCIYHPDLGPPGLEACGICEDCDEYEYSSFFCSQECYRQNLRAHRDEAYPSRHARNFHDTLQFYQPAPDMEIIS